MAVAMPADVPAPAAAPTPAPAAPVAVPAAVVPAAVVAPAAPVAGAPSITPAVVPAPAAPVVAAAPTYALKAPEGYEPADVAEVVAFAQAHKLSPEAAQNLLDRQAQVEREFVADAQARATAVSTGWEAAAAADPQIGGAALPQTLQHAADVAARFGSPQFAAEVKAAGAKLPPEFLRFCAAVAKATGPDAPPKSNQPAGVKLAPHQILYPSTK